jgi:Ohr subfamily peroxiredoxin
MEINDIFYRAEATAIAGRHTQVRTPGGELKLDLVVPRQLGGTNGPGSTPELLFAACCAASFLAMLRLAASREKVALPSETEVDASVDFGSGVAGFAIEVELIVRLPGLARSDVDMLSLAAFELCPYCCPFAQRLSVRLG